MFTPKWKSDALHLVKGARKFVHYKRDLLTSERVAEIESRRLDLLAAIKTRDLAQVKEAMLQVQTVCENSLPADKPQGWFEENVEVMFVAIVIALGLRAYYLQPFRIPTGSMQPTLNGIIGTPIPQAQWPSLPQRLWEKLVRGRSYVYLVNDRDRHVAVTPQGNMDMRDVQVMHFFSRAEINFVDSKPLRLPAPISPCRDIGLAKAQQVIDRNRGLLPAGTVLCEGAIDSGDLVLVDKVSYHFRKPQRGEVFVFDTLGIRGIHNRSGDQAAGSHYIKRLCGVPGDTVSIQPPHLLIDGKIAKEPGIQRVMRAEGVYAQNPQGYLLPADGGYLNLSDNNQRLSDKAGMREYLALGDNTDNSFDSRYWGTVKEFNLVGPALFSLWPVTTGHWGFIH